MQSGQTSVYIANSMKSFAFFLSVECGFSDQITTHLFTTLRLRSDHLKQNV